MYTNEHAKVVALGTEHSHQPGASAATLISVAKSASSGDRVRASEDSTLLESIWNIVTVTRVSVVPPLRAAQRAVPPGTLRPGNGAVRRITAASAMVADMASSVVRVSALTAMVRRSSLIMIGPSLSCSIEWGRGPGYSAGSTVTLLPLT